eukprot:TRINITY_DN2087_c0_g2_i1.p2 TRINITY_DN2087_c0_g2~~TRINITY_DN2087_c0_g2_i1.p2  ORF type:complete len:124 (-),score=20.40 TRINITY_DN2087_c0_g2_i1:496-867(-)
MAQSRSAAAPLLVLIAGSFFACLLLQGNFVPSPSMTSHDQALRGHDAAKVALMTALATGASAAPAFAIEEEDSFDYSLLIVLGLPLTALAWALSNVWRVGFRQLRRIGESESGSSKLGLGAED